MKHLVVQGLVQEKKTIIKNCVPRRKNSHFLTFKFGCFPIFVLYRALLLKIDKSKNGQDHRALSKYECYIINTMTASYHP